MQAPLPSIFERTIARPRPAWVTILLSIALLGIPFVLAFLNGELEELMRTGIWRPALTAPVIIAYILIVAPILGKEDARVMREFRSISLLDEQEFTRLVMQAGYTKPLHEAIAFGIGAAFGVWLDWGWVASSGSTWFSWYAFFSSSIMFGVLAWTIYITILGTRITTALHRQPLKVDLFDTKPFEPIGRQSLGVALTFVGGITLSMLFGMNPQSIYSWQSLFIYSLLGLVPVLVFFLNMRDTHTVLARAKTRELESVERILVSAMRELMQRIAENQDTGKLSSEINALALYEQRVRVVRTWPYNTAMLRTLFFSVFVPAGTAIASALLKQLFER